MYTYLFTRYLKNIHEIVVHTAIKKIEKSQKIGKANVHENKNLLLQTRFISLIFHCECNGIKKNPMLEASFLLNSLTLFTIVRPITSR